MINAYLYCSYKGSPVGFRIGKIMYELPEDKDYAELSLEGIDGFIRKAFESGIVDEAFDKIISKDGTERYFVMVKKLSYSDPVSTGNASEIYMNFAFEFDKYDEYERFAEKSTVSQKKLWRIRQKISSDRQTKSQILR